MVSLRQLRYFVEVVEAGSFSAAAERLFVAQSALSRQIRDLEQSAQVVLLSRAGRQTTLTPAGRTFYDGAKRLLFGLNDTLLQARQTERGGEGIVRLVHSSSVVLGRDLLAALQRFLDAQPGASLDVSQMTSDHQATELVEGRSDLGLVRLPVTLVHADVSVEALFDERLYLAVPPGHRLARLPSCSLADLRDEAFVSQPHAERGGLGFRVAELCLRHGFFPRGARATSRKTTQLNLVAAGFGVSIVPDGMRLIAPPEVGFVVLNDVDASTTVGMLRRNDAAALTEACAASLRGAAARRGARA
ncbi:LysR family transcriptional regulator [Chitinasiproducens palmae]|uniref:DNA-binding transcriptional regulator, LysR family n=1 Tax=Chitinasiproducens palmae TaxID=1770053 RepID=A0A1H2PUJ3_9BURK|nr:LysR family transcriptional regulator [Chitinasiproducens palmae]SDV50484.1 DNA-binding transcriptional regulator, LysR family [Chitinasiproducens palmae]